MRYKIILFIVISIVNYKLSDGSLRGPLESNKKHNTDEESKSFIASYKNDNDESSAMKIVQPPDLSKEKDKIKGRADLLLKRL